MNNLKIYKRVKIVYSLEPPKHLESGVEVVAEVMLTDREVRDVEFAMQDFKKMQKDLSQRVLAKRGINYTT